MNTIQKLYIRWLAYYLEHCTQTVQGFSHSFVPVTPGVRQGSHLCPLLYNIFL